MPRAWMPLYVADYLADTRHLGALEHGAYLLLIMHYWQTGSLPNDDRQLARIAATSPDEWATVRDTVGNFFKQPGWKHPRIDGELARSADISDKRRGAAGARWGPHDTKHEQSNSNANAQQVQVHKNPFPPKPPFPSQSQSQSPGSTNLRGEEGSEPERKGPRHGAESKARGTIYFRKGTPEWEQYAADYKSAHQGVEPTTDRYGGHWFNRNGEHQVRKHA